jgi:hypothetical protein
MVSGDHSIEVGFGNRQPRPPAGRTVVYTRSIAFLGEMLLFSR